MHTIDFKGVECPVPVLETKKALLNYETVCSIVDNAVAMENIMKMVEDLSGVCNVNNISDHTYYIYSSLGKELMLDEVKSEGVLVFSSEFMGENKEIGASLIQACIHVIGDLNVIPKKIIFYNSGVVLANKYQQVYNDLLNLKERGVDIILCGACVEYFGVNKYVGRISNMYEIMQIITSNKVSTIGG